MVDPLESHQRRGLQGSFDSAGASHSRSTDSAQDDRVEKDYGFTVTITTPCEATGVENFSVSFPRSLCCQRSRTAAFRWLGYTRSCHAAVMFCSDAPRLSS